jgi:hypothetical protein
MDFVAGDEHLHVLLILRTEAAPRKVALVHQL